MADVTEAAVRELHMQLLAMSNLVKDASEQQRTEIFAAHLRGKAKGYEDAAHLVWCLTSRSDEVRD